MEIGALKEYIYENEFTETILKNIGCHSINYNRTGGYWTCGNYDGDNKQAITVYNSPSLNCVNYTRNIGGKKKSTDLLDLASYALDLVLTDTLKHISAIIGINYYHDFEKDIPESLLITKLMLTMSGGNEDDEDMKAKPISENILSYYSSHVNDMFFNDNIPYDVQQEFEVGYDDRTQCITIPVRSEIGDLVGVKGRRFTTHISEDESKYFYLEPTPRSAILYGLCKTIHYIKSLGVVYVVESEKAVMQLWAYGFRNAVGTGGKKISSCQVNMLTRLAADIVLCFDKDVSDDELQELSERFEQGVPVYKIKDFDNILEGKESPTDDPYKWEILRKNKVLLK